MAFVFTTTFVIPRGYSSCVHILHISYIEGTLCVEIYIRNRRVDISIANISTSLYILKPGTALSSCLTSHDIQLFIT
jgi:hypothetical protein